MAIPCTPATPVSRMMQAAWKIVSKSEKLLVEALGGVQKIALPYLMLQEQSPQERSEPAHPP